MVTRLEQIKASIRILASDSVGQISYLIRIGHRDGRGDIRDLNNIDELALQFEHADHATDGLMREGVISRSAAGAIEDLRLKLLRYSHAGEAEFWTVGALKNDVRWEHIRDLASRSILLMENI